MSENKPIFDADKLMDRKNKFCGFNFCPLCGEKLTEGEYDGRTRLGCPATGCGYIFYQNPVPAAGAIIVENNQILLVKRAHPPKVGWWCIPAGFMEWGEHPSATAVREVKEETGLEVELTSLFEIYTGSDDPRTNAVLILYLANVIGGKMEAADDALDVRFFSFDNLPEKIAFESHYRAFNDYRNRIASTQ